jgi:cell division protein FtsI (penicillin-binding protein 3)
MALLILGSFAVLIGRAFYLQTLNNDFLQEKGESRYRRDIEISASRGRIADRHGDVLAISTPMKSIWAIPPATTDVAGTDQTIGRLCWKPTPSNWPTSSTPTRLSFFFAGRFHRRWPNRWRR